MQRHQLVSNQLLTCVQISGGLLYELASRVSHLKIYQTFSLYIQFFVENKVNIKKPLSETIAVCVQNIIILQLQVMLEPRSAVKNR